MRMTEGELQGKVLAECRELRLACFRARPGQLGGLTPAGWPDLVIAGPGGLLFRELKSARGSMSRQQRKVAWELMQAGADYALWRPRHWLDGAIEAELKALA